MAARKQAGLVVDRDVLTKALAKAKMATESKSTAPLLDCVLLQQQDKQLKVSATTLYVSLEVTLSVEPNGADLSLCVDAKKLYEATKAMPEGFVRLREEAKVLLVEHVTSKRSFKLRALPPAEYPSIPRSLPTSQGFSVETPFLLQAIADVERALSDDVSNPAKNSMLIETLDNETRLVATDGHRMHITILENARTPNRTVVPKAGVLLIRGAVEGSPRVEVRREGASVFFDATGTVLSVKLVGDDVFPNYQHIVPKRGPVEMGVNARELLDAVKAVGLMSSEKSGGVKFEMEEGKLLVSAEDGEGKGGSKDEVAADYKGPKNSFEVNAKYVIDALAPLDGERVEIGASGPLDPVSFSSGTYRAIVMPIRPTS